VERSSSRARSVTRQSAFAIPVPAGVTLRKPPLGATGARRWSTVGRRSKGRCRAVHGGRSGI
jgi:hypothetical protein